MLLSIIIVNYKTPELTLRCVESIYNSNSNNFEIIIVDNNSQDNSENKVTERFKDVVWINNALNEGFGRANNLGVIHAKGDYFLFLNSDILVLQNTITKCLSHIRSNKQIGVLGCKLLNDDHSFQKSTYNYVGDYVGVLKDNLLYDYFFKPKLPKVKAVMGAFMIIPKNVFELVNGFDPDFFMYAEELELCNRICKKKFLIEYMDTVTAIHKHGGSATSSNWQSKQNYLSNALLYLKTKGLFGYFTYHFLMINNGLTNFLLLWKMDKAYRTDFLKSQQYYFSNFVYYLKIPFLYSKKRGNGKRYLKRT